MSPEERSRLMDDLIEGEISEADFLRLEAELSVDPLVRQEYYKRLELTALLEEQAEIQPLNTETIGRFNFQPNLALAAALALLLMAAGYGIFKFRNDSEPTITSAPRKESQVNGYAVVAAQADAEWVGETSDSIQEGSLISSKIHELSSGLVQLEMFSGATVFIEGPAAFRALSPMDLEIIHGKIRANVPVPAQGFKVHTQAGEVVDLGTEFALNVHPTETDLFVIEGEVEWWPTDGSMSRFIGGNGARWNASNEQKTIPPEAESNAVSADFVKRLSDFRISRLRRWEQYKEALSEDPRLVVYYLMGESAPGARKIMNLASVGEITEGYGSVVAAREANNRWGRPQEALDFSPAGSRVRLSVTDPLHSLTLLCWVKINSLDRWYNSLFLTDGHELNEPHWQIMDDGRLFFSVKKNDRWDRSRGIMDKHIFYSPQFWDPSLSGQWLMLATTYDIEKRQVTHLLNGKKLSQERIPDEYLVETVRIGNASLGNWGLPERDDPKFAVRNLNGSMDEFALFNTALSAEEIYEIYANGKP